MRQRTRRHLEPVLAPPQAVALSAPRELAAPESNWRDHCVMLLHVAAAIEHALMVQYLFSAYALAGPQVPERLQGAARRWQETVLGIAKEEMAHLVTIENLLRALGAPLSLEREEYPWDSEFYPFRFTLQPLGLDALATYICAESPDDWSGEEADEILARAGAEAGAPVNRVSALYQRLYDVLADPARIPDDAFQAWTLPYQASWDEWGRGYRRGERGVEAGNVPGVDSPDLLIMTVSSRATALEALAEVGEQGEATQPLGDVLDPDATSHFRRFLTVYREMRALPEEDRRLVARPVAENPRTTRPGASGAEITHPEALAWAHLFNLRYRMLLVNVGHALRLATPLAGGDSPARGLLIHRTFAEMYNLRSIAGILVRLPLSANDPDGPRAGPPFEMPYTLDLPDREADRWLVHRDLFEASASLTGTLEAMRPVEGAAYLTGLAEQDRAALATAEHLARGADHRPAASGAPV